MQFHRNYSHAYYRFIGLSHELQWICAILAAHGRNGQPSKWANSVNFCCLLSVMGIHACVTWVSRDIHTRTSCSSLLYASPSFGLFNLQHSNSRLAFLLFQLWFALPDSMDVLGGPLARRFLHVLATTRSACFGTAHASTSSSGNFVSLLAIIVTFNSVLALGCPSGHNGEARTLPHSLYA